MKVIFFILFNLILLSILEKSYASDLEDELIACTSVFREQNSTNTQIEEAKQRIEELACLGNSHSFNLLWYLRKENNILSEVENKAVFMRDFLVNSLPISAMCNAGNQIIEYQKTSPTFLPTLQLLIDQDSEKNMIHSKLKLALGVGYIVCNEPNKHDSLWMAWQLIQEWGRMDESHNQDFTENACMYKACKLLWKHAYQSNHFELINNSCVQNVHSNPLMSHIHDINTAFIAVFKGTSYIKN